MLYIIITSKKLLTSVGAMRKGFTEH